jgi:signal transduction histidine kinase
MRERIFQPFVRLSDRVTDGVAGSGIGLTIARELARLHGGDLTVLPSEEGAVFEVRLETRVDRLEARG